MKPEINNFEENFKSFTFKIIGFLEISAVSLYNWGANWISSQNIEQTPTTINSNLFKVRQYKHWPK